MRRAPKTPLVSGTLYRNVAILAVGLAVLVALFGSGDRDASDGIRVPVSGSPDRAAAVVPQGPEAVQFDETADVASPVQPGAAEIAPPDAGPGQVGPAPPLPAGTKLPAPRGQMAKPAAPTAAQIQHLIEQSRIRSGANPGGD